MLILHDHHGQVSVVVESSALADTVVLWVLYPLSFSTLSLNSYSVPFSSPVMVPSVTDGSSSYLLSHATLEEPRYSMMYSSTEESNISHFNVTELDVVSFTISPVGVTIVTSYSNIAIVTGNKHSPGAAVMISTTLSNNMIS